MSCLKSLYNENGTLIIIIENALPTKNVDDLTHWLKNQTYFGEGSYKNIKLNREQIWFHKEGKTFCSLWKKEYERWKGHLYDDFLNQIQEKIIKVIYQHLEEINIKLDLGQHNSCLINKYDDGTKFIHPHKDSSEAFGLEPTIIGFSVGATRDFVLTSTKEPKTIKFELNHNAIFIMAGRSQLDWKHSIPAKPFEQQPRYSLTIRNHLL